jgi:hypothetical protein
MTGFSFSCYSDVDKKPVFDIPTIREYFMDLDFVLGVISDGPAKSYAFRRLQYLRGKFTMYTLLNEFQEMTEMKVRFASHPKYCSEILNIPSVARSSPVT